MWGARCLARPGRKVLRGQRNGPCRMCWRCYGSRPGKHPLKDSAVIGGLVAEAQPVGVADMQVVDSVVTGPLDFTLEKM